MRPTLFEVPRNDGGVQICKEQNSDFDSYPGVRASLDRTC
jgi:hypothetical protein